LLEQYDGAAPVLLARAAEVRLQRLGDLEAHGEAGVQRGHRLLKDHRHVLADDPAARPRRHGEQIAAVEGEAVGGEGGGTRKEAPQRPRGNQEWKSTRMK